MIALRKIIDNVLSKSQIDELPKDIKPVSLFTWDPDLSSDKDWDDFIGGQLVCHNYWDTKSFKGMVDITNLEFGSSPNSFWGMMNMNESVTIYTSNFLDLNGKFITIGDDTKTFYYCISIALNNFKLRKGLMTKSFFGKLILINFQKFMDNQYNDNNEAPIINITAGKLNETIKVPVIKKAKNNEISDPDIKEYEEGSKIIPQAQTVEIFMPKPAILIGGGVDFVSNEKRKEDAPANLNKLIEMKKGSVKPKTFPQNPYYCILPTQWQVPSIDNYGWTHPADRSNFIKMIMATQAIGSAATTGINAGGSLGVIGKIASAIGTASIGLGQKFFGDKGTLANSTAINASFLSGEGDPIKFFIQGDASKVPGGMEHDGYMDFETLQSKKDYLEINQANGDFGKYGKSMSPTQNKGFDNKNQYRALGLDSIDCANGQYKYFPVLATPFAPTIYSKLKINATKISDIMKSGVPRLNVSSGDILKPMAFPETWDVYVRNMFFRPDPYSFWNWPCLMPAEIGVWDVRKQTSIAYDNRHIADTLLEKIGIENSEDNTNTRPKSYWNKTITVDQITNNDLYDPNKTFSSYRYEFRKDALEDFYQIQLMAITSSVIHVKVLDEKDEVIREHKFNSQGKNIGTSASWGTVLQL